MECGALVFEGMRYFSFRAYVVMGNLIKFQTYVNVIWKNFRDAGNLCECV